MKFVILFAALLGCALSDDYVCPEQSEIESYGLSFCAWDPCMVFEDIPHPCKAPHQDAVCKYDACPNFNCDYMFFVNKTWVPCVFRDDIKDDVE